MKYRIRFDAIANLEKKSFKTFEAKASIDELKELRALLPPDEEIRENDDLLYCSFNLATAGVINANNHGIRAESAVKMAESFKLKPMNIEHDRYNNVGVITSVGFSSFPGNKMMTREEALESKEPFNLCVGAVVWKVSNPWFAAYIEETNDPKDAYSYKRMSSSWEAGFNEYVIARGSKNLFDAEIIEDKEEITRLSKYLTQSGGTGFDEKNKEVYMVLSGNVRGLGGGFTSNPAAPVNGVYVPEIKEEEEEEREEEEEDSKAEIVEKASKEVVAEQENDKNIKNNFTPVVKRVLRSDMKFTDLDNFVDKYSEAIAKNEVIATSDVRDFVKESLLKSAEGWKSELDKQEEKAALAAKKADEMQAALDVAKEDAKANASALEALRAELAEVKAKADEAANRQIFDARMNELEEKYDLSDKVRSVIAKSILNKDEDQYNEWLANEGEVILAGKEKKAVTVEDSLKTATASADHVPNADVTEEVKVAKALKPTAKREGRDFVISLN